MEASLDALRDEVLAELVEVRRDLAQLLKRRRRKAVTPPCAVPTPASPETPASEEEPSTTVATPPATRRSPAPAPPSQPPAFSSVLPQSEGERQGKRYSTAPAIRRSRLQQESPCLPSCKSEISTSTAPETPESKCSAADSPPPRYSQLTEVLPRLCGLLPWDARRISTAYQVLIWLLAASCTIHLVTADSWGDVAVGLGALFGLPACWRPAVGEALLVMRNMRDGQERSSWRISGTALFLWALVLAWRALAADGLLAAHSFGVVALLYVAVACTLHHCCEDLLSVVDGYCLGVKQMQSFESAVRRWNAIHATCQKICSAVQHIFAVLLAVAMFEVLRALLAFTAEQADFELARGLPALLVVLPSFRALACAAAISDKCAQVPPVVNCITTSKHLDAKRMYAVQHVFFSQAGFTVFGLRVTSSSVLKALYIACAAAVAMMSQLRAIMVTQ